MDNIKITSGGTVLTMPRTRNIEMGGEIVAKIVTMASGRNVQYIQGFRPSFTAEWDWFPNDLLAQLVQMLRGGGFYTVEYPDQDGNAHSGMFSISYPNTAVFKYVGGVPMWHGVKMTFTAQEVS